MRVLRSMLLAALALGMISSVTHADQADSAKQVDNPKYAAWAKFGVGSSQTLESNINANNMVIHTTLVRTLKEKTADHVTVEVSTTIDVGGQQHTPPARSQTEPAKVDKVDAKETGAEDVTAAGKTYHCKVWEAKSPSGQPTESNAKLWVSDDVPGGLVKMEGTSARGTITFTLKSSESK